MVLGVDSRHVRGMILSGWLFRWDVGRLLWGCSVVVGNSQRGWIRVMESAVNSSECREGILQVGKKVVESFEGG